MHNDEVWQLYKSNGEERAGVGRDSNLGNPGADEDNIVGAVMILLYRHGEHGLEFLWQKRAKNLPEGGKWDFSAAGHVNLGESFVDAAIRETREEISADTNADEMEFYFEHRLYNGMFVRHYVVDWDGRNDNFAFDDGEVTEVRWVPYSEMTEFRHKNAKWSLGHEEQIFITLDKWLKNHGLVADEKKTKSNYAFIDGNNLYLGIKSQGFSLDYRVFRLFLKNKYNVDKAFIFIGFDSRRKDLYKHFRECGFELVFKPTVKFTQNDRTLMKGNVDAELVLYTAAVEYDNYDKAIIVTGDGDFACLAKYLQENNKLGKILAPTSKYSLLLRDYKSFIAQLKDLKCGIIPRKDYNKSTGLAVNACGTNQTGTVATHSRSVETLG